MSATPFLSTMVVKNQYMGSKGPYFSQNDNVASSSRFQGNFNYGYNGYQGNSRNYQGNSEGNRSKYKGKGKASNNQRYYNIQGQKFYNSKPIVYDYAPTILGNPSQFSNGGPSSIVICQICSQQGHFIATCVYRSTKTSDTFKKCQICDRNNHTAKTCFYRNKGKNSQMSAMNTIFSSMPPQSMYNMPFMMPTMPTSMMNMSSHPVSNQMTAAISYRQPSMIASTSNQVPQQVWLTGSGATNHMTHDLNNLSFATPYPQHGIVQTANGEGLPIIHIGNTVLRTPYQSINLHYVLYVPKLSHNLLSVHKICLDNNCWLIFDAYYFWIQDKVTGRILFKGHCNNGLHPILSIVALPSSSIPTTSSAIACLGKKMLLLPYGIAG